MTGPMIRDFINRAAVRKLYRDALKLARHTPPNVRTSIRDEARSQIETDIVHNNNPSTQQVQFLLYQGRERIEQLRKMLNLTANGP